MKAWDKISVAELSCHCRGYIWRGKAQLDMEAKPYPRMFSQEPCPNCGRCDQIVAIRGEPETFRIN